MEFIVRNIWGGSVRFENGVECKATENNVSKLTDTIFNQMPPNHTLFKSYDSLKGIWTIEVYSGMRDHNTEPIWKGKFIKITVEDLKTEFEKLEREDRGIL